MVKLIDIAKVIRSKNSGPFELTFDIIFKDKEIYEKVKGKKAINSELIKRLYKISEDKIIGIYYFDPALAVKFTIVRPLPAGHLGETDIYGAQQHAPLLNAELEL
ncbi:MULTISPECIES: DUF4387 domain-containing protein [Carboxydothermus]|uniref:DUF4387 domain-containing protein n=2 Tax=Carboxydothermus TaxID=129957 RepID=Q3AEJ4_CARHZ|nr:MULTISPECIES: DUF4387 domain-containing protein [Carboxydothermus]ABB14692.1 conserved hypothetical protein [Carboxydothermus hydrogenoformans Z-2901]NYE56463.1 hypothetical protein [Carboxydothermus ferrireducens DSM 11255]